MGRKEGWNDGCTRILPTDDDEGESPEVPVKFEPLSAVKVSAASEVPPPETLAIMMIINSRTRHTPTRFFVIVGGAGIHDGFDWSSSFGCCCC